MCLETVHHCNYKWKLRTLRIKGWQKLLFCSILLALQTGQHFLSKISSC